jgi:uncharacterized protein (TIGR03066 family)
MRILWTVSAGWLALALVGAGSAGDKKDKAIDKAKLVGVWELVKGESLPEGATVEFTNDGKIRLVATKGDKTLKLEGTYKVEGNKFHLKVKAGEKEHEEDVTVTTLTDTRLVTLDDKGKTDEFKRKKKS